MIRYAWRQFWDTSGDPLPDAPTSYKLAAVIVLLFRALLVPLWGIPVIMAAVWMFGLR